MFRLEDERSGVCTIGYDETYNAVIISWTRNDNELFRSMLETQLRLVVEHKATVVIIDTSETTGVLNDVNQAWLGEDYFPRLSRTGLAAMIHVVPRSATAVLVNRRSFRGREVSFAILETSSLDEAQALASTYKPALSA